MTDTQNSLEPGLIRLTQWKVEFATKEKIYSWEFKSKEEFMKIVGPLLASLQERYGPVVMEDNV